jgi:hypothetical protein
MKWERVLDNGAVKKTHWEMKVLLRRCEDE